MFTISRAGGGSCARTRRPGPNATVTNSWRYGGNSETSQWRCRATFFPFSFQKAADPGPADSVGCSGREPDLTGHALDVGERDRPEATRVDRRGPVVAEDEDLAVGDDPMGGRGGGAVAGLVRNRRGDEHMVCAAVAALATDQRRSDAAPNRPIW